MTAEGPVRTVDSGSDLSEYTRIVVTHRRMIGACVLVASLLALLLSLIGPEVYRSQVTLLIADSRSTMIPSSLADNPLVMDLLGAGGGTYHSGRIFIEMLQSRSVLEGVARQLDLVRVFRYDRLSPEEGMEETITRLRNSADFLETESGILRVTVRASTPFFPDEEKRRRAARLAADIGNAFAEQLNRVNDEKGASQARALRIYLEDQIKIMEAAMHATADSLTQFQLANRAVALEQQTEAAVEGAGVLRGQIAATEIELALLGRTMRPENPQLRSIRARLAEMQRQYEKLTLGAPGLSENEDFLVPFANLPLVGQRLARLTLDLKIKQTVLQLLTQQYYQARIEETKDVPSLTVLDPGIPAVRRWWPKRKILFGGTAIGSFVAAILVALVLERRDSRRRNETAAGHALAAAGHAGAPR